MEETYVMGEGVKLMTEHLEGTMELRSYRRPMR